jgi:hypothetical protein
MLVIIEEDQDWAAMLMLPPDFAINSYFEATKVIPTSSPNLYFADLK